MKNNISPEEKLLRLIKGQKKNNTDIPLEKELIKTHPELEPAFNYSIRPPVFTAASLHKIILVAFLFSGIYFIGSLIYPFIGFKKISLPSIIEEGFIEPKTEPKQNIKPLDLYLEGIKDSHIFAVRPESEPEKPTTSVSASADVIKDINLVGIISGENPQVVIEDKKTQKTYYINKGQFFGDFLVEDIQEGKVVLNYKGQKFELYL